MYQYPYGNAQQLNLDWILSKIQEIEANNVSPSDIKIFVNAVLSASYDSSSAYNVNDIVFNDSQAKLYRCNTAIPVGGEAWDTTHWDEILLAPVITNLVEAVANMSSDDVFNESTVAGIHVTDALDALSASITAAAQAAVTNVRYNSHKLQQQINGAYSEIIKVEDTPTNNSDRLASSKLLYEMQREITDNVETSTTTSQAYALNDFLALANVLYHVKAAIAAGGTITEGTNVETTNVADWLIPEIGSSGGITYIQFKFGLLIQMGREAADFDNSNMASGEITLPRAYNGTTYTAIGCSALTGVNTYLLRVGCSATANNKLGWCVGTGDSLATSATGRVFTWFTIGTAYGFSY